jgi:AcrR family transcriptional regulator
MATEKTFQLGPVRVRVHTSDAPTAPRERQSRDRIVEVALAQMKERGYEAVSMRSIAKELGTGPASLYAHVANKDELDQLLVDRVARELPIPEPDPERWDEQLMQLMRDMRATFQEHPGSARAALGMIPTGVGALRVMEAILGLCTAGGVRPQAAAWFCDVSAAYVSAIAVEEAIWIERHNTTPSGEAPDHEQLDAQLRQLIGGLPADVFPLVSTMAGPLTAGDGDERFAFGITLLVEGLKAVSARAAG